MNQEVGPKYTGMSMQEILKELSENSERIVENPREYVLNEVPKVEDLELLCGLPFEIDIFSQSERLIASTRNRTDRGRPLMFDFELADIVDLHMQTLDNSYVDFHSHPNLSGAFANHASPSDYSTFLCEMYNNKRPSRDSLSSLIGTPKGLIVLSAVEESNTAIVRTFLNRMESIRWLAGNKFVTEEEYGTRVQEITKDFVRTEYVPWDQAQPIIDQHMSPQNWKKIV